MVGRKCALFFGCIIARSIACGPVRFSFGSSSYGSGFYGSTGSVLNRFKFQIPGSVRNLPAYVYSHTRIRIGYSYIYLFM